MEHATIRTATSVVLTAMCLLLLPSVAEAATKQRACGSNPGHTLQHFLDELNPGDTLIVSGTCKENVVIDEDHSDLIIEGKDAMIDGSGDPNLPAVLVRGRSITIKGFKIIGGRQGVIFVNGGTGTVDNNEIWGAIVHGVGTFNNSFARIVDNTIRNNGANGICVCEHSSAEIGFRGDFATQPSPNFIRNNTGNGIAVSHTSYADVESNTVSGNGGVGIVVADNSSARIGFRAGVAGTLASRNTIETNGNQGILVTRSSNARIVENTIRENIGHGISVVRVSQADIGSNDISDNRNFLNGNPGHGVSVNQNSGVNLGNDSGSDPDDQPNTTTTLNAGHGIYCSNNSYVDGRQGTLAGVAGNAFFASTCVNSLLNYVP